VRVGRKEREGPDILGGHRSRMVCCRGQGGMEGKDGENLEASDKFRPLEETSRAIGVGDPG